MKKFWRGLIALFAVFSMAGASVPVVAASAATNVDVYAKAALAVDAKTGKILYAKNADTALPLASMTKMLSAYLVRQAIQSGKLKWTDTVTPDASIYKISQDHSLSNVPLRRDGKYTIRELYQASLIYSANAAMMLLGNAVAGSQVRFVNMMRTQLKAWGIDDATIVNATGLDNNQLTVDRYPGTTGSEQNMMSAKDVARVAQHLLTDYPDVLKTTSIANATFRAGTADATKMESFDWMLKGLVSAQKDLPVDGLKTGTTDRAGDCFTGTVEKNGMRIITVVMHANGKGSTKRFVQTANLMRAVFAAWQPLRVTTKGKTVAGRRTIEAYRGAQPTVKQTASKTLTLIVPKGTTAKQLTTTYQAASIVHNSRTPAPITKGTKLGTLSYAINGDTLGYLDGAQTQSVKLQAAKTVKKANPFVLIWRGTAKFFGDLF